MGYQKMWSLVEKIAQKTADGKLSWEQTGTPQLFQCSFPNFTTLLGYENNDYTLMITNSEGVIIESATDVQLKKISTRAFRVMRSLYEDARRNAMGVDAALDEILDDLSGDDEPI